jgi:hypothetical protein
MVKVEIKSKGPVRRIKVDAPVAISLPNGENVYLDYIKGKLKIKVDQTLYEPI